MRKHCDRLHYVAHNFSHRWRRRASAVLCVFVVLHKLWTRAQTQQREVLSLSLSISLDVCSMYYINK